MKHFTPPPEPTGPYGLPPINCNGCRKCCIDDTITLLPEYGDNPDDFECVKTEFEGVVTYTLEKGDDGQCTYLGPTGCTIYGRQPYRCKVLDCRVYFLRYENNPQAMADRLVGQPRETMLEGQARVFELRRVHRLDIRHGNRKERRRQRK